MRPAELRSISWPDSMVSMAVLLVVWLVRLLDKDVLLPGVGLIEDVAAVIRFKP